MRLRPERRSSVEAGVHAGPIIINKPLALIGEKDAEIRGNGSGNVVTIAADDVTAERTAHHWLWFAIIGG